LVWHPTKGEQPTGGLEHERLGPASLHLLLAREDRVESFRWDGTKACGWIARLGAG